MRLKKSVLRVIKLWLLIFLILVTIVFIFFYFIYPKFTSYNFQDLKSSYNSSLVLLDRNDVLLREVTNSDGNFAYWLDYNQIPQTVVDSLIAAEDERFYQHHGIDYRAIIRALVGNIKNLEVHSGASTISMQLARMVDNHNRDIFGKIAQIFTARYLEARLTKEEILTLYLNMVPIGGGNSGVEAGSKEYFDTSINLLSQAQVATLIGIIQGPSLYNPRKNSTGAIVRRNYVLSQLKKLELINTDIYNRALNEPLITKSRQLVPQAMHFTDYVIFDNQKEKLKGLHKTTLDLDLNNKIERQLRTHIQQLKQDGITHGSIVVVDNSTMDIISMVGSPDYWDGDQGSNNGAVTRRQPGSTLKPFTYAKAFTLGKNPSDIISDIPVSFVGTDNKLYEPRNYSDKFLGPVTLYDALGRSLNIPAVKLANFIGIDRLLESYRSYGLLSLVEGTEYYGLGLTLGSGEVSLLELVRSYTIFPNKGFLKDYRSLEKHKVSSGKKVISEPVCYLITDILSNKNVRLRAFGINNPLLFQFPISIKTGTSNNWKDNWVIGYTKDFTIGIWVGNFSGEPTNQYSGIVGAGPLFQQVANLVHYKLKSSNKQIWVKMPDGVIKKEICLTSGLQPNDYCPQTRFISVETKDYKSQICDIHREVIVDTRNGFIATEFTDNKHQSKKIYEYLDTEYYYWMMQNNLIPPPTKFSPLKDSVINFTILNPRDGDIFIYEPGYNPKTQSIELIGSINKKYDGVFWYINGIKSKECFWPYIDSLPLRKGSYALAFGTENVRSPVINITVK